MSTIFGIKVYCNDSDPTACIMFSTPKQKMSNKGCDFPREIICGVSYKGLDDKNEVKWVWLVMKIIIIIVM